MAKKMDDMQIYRLIQGTFTLILAAAFYLCIISPQGRAEAEAVNAFLDMAAQNELSVLSEITYNKPLNARELFIRSIEGSGVFLTKKSSYSVSDKTSQAYVAAANKAVEAAYKRNHIQQDYFCIIIKDKNKFIYFDGEASEADNIIAFSGGAAFFERIEGDYYLQAILDLR